MKRKETVSTFASAAAKAKEIARITSKEVKITKVNSDWAHSSFELAFDEQTKPYYMVTRYRESDKINGDSESYLFFPEFEQANDEADSINSGHYRYSASISIFYPNSLVNQLFSIKAVEKYKKHLEIMVIIDGNKKKREQRKANSNITTKKR
ncbi:hypothetical protein AB6C87_01030 [Vibrio splendidus]